MQKMEAVNFAPGFTTQDRELNFENLEITGSFPDWLNGSLIRTGPALFELESQNLNHWFDGLAMLYKFSFQQGKVDFCCKFLKSKAYLEAEKTGRIRFKEWATDPCKTVFETAKSYLQAPDLTDNGNINIITFGDELMATSETPLPIVFDKTTLESLGTKAYDDELQGHIETAHPHYDRQGNIYSYLLQYGLSSTYQVYKMKPGSRKREIIAKISALRPYYIHSFSFTENYLILPEIPYVINPMEVKFLDKPLAENYHYKPELGTKIQLINLHTGETSAFDAPPFFMFHQVNAYEEADEVHMDVIASEDDDVFQALYLDRLRDNEPTRAAGHLHRISINLVTQQLYMRQTSHKPVELPHINNKRCNGLPYRYVYAAGNTQDGNWLDDITKINVETSEHLVWYQEACYPSEPIFVASPDAKEEDDGVLLSVVFDAKAYNTFLLVLDASTQEEQARAVLPEVVPFSFHGKFFSE